MTDQLHMTAKLARLPERWLWVITPLAWFVIRSAQLSQALDFRENERFYRDYAVLIAHGSFPVGDPKYQWPPGAGMLFWIVDQLPGDFHRTFTAAVILADLAILVLLLVVVARHHGSWAGPWAWIIGGLLPWGLIYERFDTFPTLISVIALLLASRPVTLGVLSGIDTLVKVWPGLNLLAVRRRDLPRAVIAFALGLVGLWVAASLLADNAGSFLANMTGRGLQIETVAAVPVLILATFKVIDAPAVDRFGTTEVATSLADPLIAISLIVGVALIGWLVVLRLRGRLEHVPGADVVLAALLVFVAFNKVNSPEYCVWLAGVGAVALVSRRSRMLPALVLAGLSYVPLVVFLSVNYNLLQAENVEAVIYQSMRGLLLLAAAISAWVIVVRQAAATVDTHTDG